MTSTTDAKPPRLGIFDSGVGGLSVAGAVHARLSHVPLLYLADQAHLPYGPRPAAEIRGFAEGITRFLLEQGATVVVVACNTASAAALHHLRGTFPPVPFVGMEPAIKPAAAQTRTGKVGVLATPATLGGSLFHQTKARYAARVDVFEDPCLGLVQAIERGDLDGAEPRRILTRALQPMLAAGIDTVVLGCTHYPFVLPLIRNLVGPDVEVIDPAPAVARQVERVLQLQGPVHGERGESAIRALSTAEPARFARQCQSLLACRLEVGAACWSAGRLTAEGTAWTRVTA